jgi:cytidylate kinase
MKPIIIAIDGYSSCGKSTLAKALAKKINYAYMDTGAMYRAVTLYVLKNKVAIFKMGESEINEIIDQVHISFETDAQGNSITLLNEEVVEEDIRGIEVSDAVSKVAQIKAIRKRMVDLQRKAGKKKGIVMDGRDIGTKVFPHADFKIFMTADPKIRAQRRYDELEAKGQAIEFNEVVENLKMRDRNDTERKENPLVQAEDAFVLDNSHLNQEEQLQLVLEKIENQFN